MEKCPEYHLPIIVSQKSTENENTLEYSSNEDFGKMFELIWTTDRGGDGFLEHLKKEHSRYDAPVINGKGIYKRILIQRKR